MSLPSSYPLYLPARRMNPGAALLAGLFAVVGIEALASQALSHSTSAQAIAPAPVVTDPHDAAPSDAAACEREPSCTLFHCF